MTTPKSLTITRFEASNVMRLKAVTITPDGNVILTGKNGEGKSSVLTAIASTLGGKKAMPEQPLRRGEKNGSTLIDLGDIVAELSLTESGETIKLTAKDGTKVASPATTLAKMWNLMCDPVRYIKLSDSNEGRREQAAILSKMVGIDFTAVNKERDTLYNEREAVGRDKRLAEGRLSGFPVHSDVPDEEQSASELMTQLQEIQKHNEGNRELRRQVAYRTEQVSISKNTLTGLANRVAELEKHLAHAQQEHDKQVEKVLEYETAMEEAEMAVMGIEDKDEATLLTQIGAIDSVNAKIRANAAHRAAQDEILSHNTKYAGLTHKIDAIDTKKQSQLAAANFPYAGLSFDEQGVKLDGVPFSQGSQAQQLVAAVAIGLALDPTIRVVLIREASLFDEDTLAQVIKLAAREKAQVWMEIVKSDDPSAVIIEDGQVKQ